MRGAQLSLGKEPARGACGLWIVRLPDSGESSRLVLQVTAKKMSRSDLKVANGEETNDRSPPH
jgi:hypothetical protein